MTNEVPPQHQDRRPGVADSATDRKQGRVVARWRSRHRAAFAAAGSRVAIDRPAGKSRMRRTRSWRMPTKGTREAGDDSLASLNTSAEISDKDYAPGMRRKSGQRVKRPEPEAKE